MGMMFQMINAKSHRAGREIWKIGDDGHHFVPARAPENQVVRGIVNDDVVGMVAESADEEGDQHADPPVTESQLAHAERDRRLHYQNRDRNQRSPRIAYHQFTNLGMGFDERSRSPGMGLLSIRLVERDLHCLSKYCIAAASSIALFAICNRPRRLSGRAYASLLWTD